MYYRLPNLIAQTTYGGGNYGSESYQQSTTSTGSDSGLLANTGTPVILAGTVGVSLVVCGIVLFVQARKKRK